MFHFSCTSRRFYSSVRLVRSCDNKMLKHGLKFPIRCLKKPRYLREQTIRYYRTSAQYYKAKDPGQKECPNEGSGRGFYYTVGALAVGTGAVVGYAKYDENFRNWLADNVPGSNQFISFVTAEETSHADYILKKLVALKNAIVEDLSALIGKQASIDTSAKEKSEPPKKKETKYKTPPSAFSSIDKKEDDSKFDEKRTIEKDEKGLPKIEADPKSVKKAIIGKLTPKSLAELENLINITAAAAVEAFTQAVCILREHADEVLRIVDESVEKVDPKIWAKLKEKGEEREKVIKEAEKNTSEALGNINQLKALIDDPSLPGGDEVRAKAKRNLDKVMAQIEDAKTVFDKVKSSKAISDTYWKKVQDARNHFAEELEILFPNVKLNDRKLKLNESEFDLFILYAYQTILHYQKELTKLETVTQQKIKSAIEKSKQGDPDKAIEVAVEQEMEKEKNKICREYQKRLLSIKADCEKDMRKQLKRHTDAHTDLLEEALNSKEQEMARRMQREIDSKLLEEKEKFNMEMASMIGRLKGMDDTLRKRACQEKRLRSAQALWSASEALVSSVGSQNACSKDLGLRPLEKEVKAIKNASSDDDELVVAVLEAIPPLALTRGVFNEPALKERFVNVLRVAQRVALLPEGGASLPVMFLSYIQSLFIISPTSPIPCSELANEPFDPKSLDTFDILQRAKYWIDRGDLYQTLRYMNLLQGASRVVSQDFMKELKLYLETKQAAEILLAHAASAGLAQ